MAGLFHLQFMSQVPHFTKLQEYELCCLAN
jgi:hypothetical protein